MDNSDNEQSKGLLSGVFGVAKKLSHIGIQTLQERRQPTRATASSGQVIEGQARQKSPLEVQKYENANQLLRAHLPQVSRQLLGRHYGRVNSVANFLLPNGTDRLADELLNSLSGLASNLSSTQWVLDEAGVKSLDELRGDPARSARIGDALAEQNKMIAITQGAFSGATGLIGSAIDVPASLTLALRLIYQTGRAYGFELEDDKDQDIVEYIFKEIDLGLVAEKQAVLMGLKALRSMIESQDLQQLQQLLGSDNRSDVLQQWLGKVELPSQLQWLSGVSKVKSVTKLTPLAGAVISAAYSWKLMEDTKAKAQEIFQTTRQYLNTHPEAEKYAILDSYEAAIGLLQAATPVLALAQSEQAEQSAADAEAVAEVKQQQATAAIASHEVIADVKVQKRTETKEEHAAPVEEKVTEGLAQLAESLVEESTPVPPQQPALSDAQREALTALQAEEQALDELIAAHEVGTPAESRAKTDTIEEKTLTTKPEAKAKRATKTSKAAATGTISTDADTQKKLNTESTAAKKTPQVSKEQVIRAVVGDAAKVEPVIVPNPVDRD